MGAIVKLMSKEELERGLELARMAGELWTVSEVATAGHAGDGRLPGRAPLALARHAVDQLLRYTSTRALAGAIKEAGQDIEAMGEMKWSKA